MLYGGPALASPCPAAGTGGVVEWGCRKLVAVELVVMLWGCHALPPCPASTDQASVGSEACAPTATRCISPRPPQMMRVDVTKFNKRFGICKMAAKAYVGEDLVCDAELTLVMGK